MPVIHTHVSVSTTKEQREALKAAYGKAITAVPGKAIPNASVKIAMVEAVPIVLHAPSPQARHRSNSRHCSSLSRPTRWSSQARHKSVPVPTCLPWNLATGRAPPVTMIAGRSALAAPIKAPCTDLSQLPMRTTPSTG